MFDFTNYPTKSKYYHVSSKLVIEKMKYEFGAVVINEFLGLNPKLYLYLVDDNNEHKKQTMWMEMLSQQ